MVSKYAVIGQICQFRNKLYPSLDGKRVRVRDRYPGQEYCPYSVVFLDVNKDNDEPFTMAANAAEIGVKN